ncbi:MAG TPA: hypothetical protein VK335_15925 [Bryobacteraceae bacterium]|nr:hypothetical protein [Bryobacteraceae bacterium]
MLPVLRVIEDHACSQAFLEGAIVDQVHDVAPCGRWGETEFVNKGPKRLHPKLETPVIVSTIEILVDDTRSITRFRERQRIKPLLQGLLSMRAWGRCGGYKRLIIIAGGTAVVSVHLQTLCPDDKNDRSRQSGAHSSRPMESSHVVLSAGEAIMGYESTGLNMRLVIRALLTEVALSFSGSDTQTRSRKPSAPATVHGSNEQDAPSEAFS